LSGVKRALSQRLSITLNVVGVSFTTFAGTVPVSGLDPYTDSALLNPWPVSRQMREAGPAVWLPEYGLLALTRYDSMRRALGLGDVLLLRHGVMMNDEMSQVLRGNTLCTNPADHDVLRRVAIKPLRPRELAELTDEVAREAERVVDPIVARGSSDASADSVDLWARSCMSISAEDHPASKSRLPTTVWSLPATKRPPIIHLRM
jgi:cytochrome P450